LSCLTQISQTDIALSRLLEATQRKQASTTLVATINALDTQVGALFVKQGNALVRALNPLRKLIKEDAISDQFDAIFDAATQATSVDMLDAMTKGYSNALLLGGKQQLSQVGIKVSFSLDNPRAAQYIRDYGADQISSIDETTRTDIRNLLRAGIENGDSYDTIASAIKARYRYYAIGAPQQHIRSRAHLIAITECGNGYQAGNFTSMQAVQDTGIKMLKHWLTIGDDRVSDDCKANQAQDWIKINEQHTSGHMHPLRFPGCRCVEQYKRDSTATPKPQPVPIPETDFNPREFANGAAADKYYTKNSPVSKDDLDYFHQSALQSYQHEGYKGINGGLRTGDKKLLKEWEAERKRLDETLASVETTEDILAHRGMFVAPGTKAQELLDLWEVGETFREPGYMSTTVDSNRVTKFLKSINAKDKPKDAKEVLIEVRVPKGTHALYMNAAVEQRGITNYKEEKELLLARDTQYRIVSKETDAKGVTHVIMEVINA